MRVTFNSNTQYNRQNPSFGLFFKCNKETAEALSVLGKGITDIIEIPDARKLYPQLKIPKNHQLYMSSGDCVSLAEARDKASVVKDCVQNSGSIRMADIKRVRKRALDVQETAPAKTAEEDAQTLRIFMLESLGVSI